MARKYPHHKVWLNGEVVDPDRANVSVFTSTAMRGANVYEGIRSYWSEAQCNLFVWKLDLHIRRHFQNMRIMRMTPPYTVEQYKAAVIEWARSNGFREDVHCRLVTYFGDGGPGDVKQYKPEESCETSEDREVLARWFAMREAAETRFFAREAQEFSANARERMLRVDAGKINTPEIVERLRTLSPEVVAVYLNAFSEMNEVDWPNLKAMLKSDPRLQLGG